PAQGRHGTEPLAGHKPLSSRSGQLVWLALRGHARRGGDFVPGVPVEDGQAREFAAGVYAVLQVWPGRWRMQFTIAAGALMRIAAGMFLAATVWAQQAQNFDNVQMRVLPVQGNIYLMAGAGGNITVQVGKDGVL